jgi:ABC-type Fe3+-hydroxamate transport system substrate-binding protein
MSARDKSTKFIELANKRVNRAIKDMQLIGNLANRQNYEFTEEQAKKIVKALQQELDALKQNFLTSGETSRNDFKL